MFSLILRKDVPMRIIAFSDSHRNYHNVQKLFEHTHLTTDIYIFLGDGSDDLENIRMFYPDKQILTVAGNCDYRSVDPLMATVEVCGKKILYTHGHMHAVNFGISWLKKLAAENGADVILYGHTHQRRCDYEDGVYYINPGSIGNPRDGLSASFAAIDVIPAGILCTHVSINELE